MTTTTPATGTTSTPRCHGWARANRRQQLPARLTRTLSDLEATMARPGTPMTANQPLARARAMLPTVPPPPSHSTPTPAEPSWRTSAATTSGATG